MRWTRRAVPLAAALLLFAAPGGGEPERHVDAVPLGPSVAERLAEVQRRIQDALVYPPRARRRGLHGTAHIRFRIDAEGHATRIETARSSGHRVLDEAAERAARNAGRLPQIYGRLEVPVRFALEF